MPLSHWSTAKAGFGLDVRQPPERAVEVVPQDSFMERTVSGGMHSPAHQQGIDARAAE